MNASPDLFRLMAPAGKIPERMIGFVLEFPAQESARIVRHTSQPLLERILLFVAWLFIPSLAVRQLPWLLVLLRARLLGFVGGLLLLVARLARLMRVLPCVVGRSLLLRVLAAAIALRLLILVPTCLLLLLAQQPLDERFVEFR